MSDNATIERDSTPTPTRAPGPAAPGRFVLALKEILSGSWVASLLAVVLALVVGAILIAASNPQVQATASYLFARPSDFFGAIWDVVSQAYAALFKGAVFNPDADGFARAIKPLGNTLTASTPLILAGLGLAIGFRAGLFNIGAQGQIIVGAIFCSWIGFAWHLPPVLHMLVALLGALVGGAIWGFIPGILKAKTGANEVIVTIMLNWIAVYGVSYLLTLDAFHRPGLNNPQTPLIDDTAGFPLIFGTGFNTHLGFILALVATAGVWWLLERSTLGFRFRALGLNPSAARTAGISTDRAVVWALVISGALAGLASSAQILGTERSLTSNVAGSFGFDAITVALLGRSRPLGTLGAGLLFGALRSGSYAMQAVTHSVDVVLVLQSVIVLLIAAPPLVRAIFRTPDPEAVGRAKAAAKAATKAAASAATKAVAETTADAAPKAGTSAAADSAHNPAGDTAPQAAAARGSGAEAIEDADANAGINADGTDGGTDHGADDGNGIVNGAQANKDEGGQS
ncbi:MAG: ABC transporter permease [Bifidobacteriaceae bacterium]|jgi:simple sugar transport system permease protein|nr:ABC transporter permease [Bifidobacteriaceae bacterium]